MTGPIDQPAKRSRSLTGFYVAIGIVVVLGLFGLWFWRTWTVWWFDADEAKHRQAEAAAKLGVPVEKAVDLGDGIALEFMLIPPGMFDMGTPPHASLDASPLHRVRISKAFYMGKHEVTQEAWAKLMGSNPAVFKGSKHPVEHVSWEDCQEFLTKLNGLGKGLFRLPTEAEWEWACRAGTRTRFCRGDDAAGLTEYAWFDADSGRTPHPVGEKRPNAWGLHDCHGNVREWCADWYGEYSANPWPGVFRCTSDPQGPASSAFRVMRGGAWGYLPSACCSSSRYNHYPGTRDDCGLRVLLMVSP